MTTRFNKGLQGLTRAICSLTRIRSDQMKRYNTALAVRTMVGLRPLLAKSAPLPAVPTRSFSVFTRCQKQLRNREDIEEFLSTPSWSVRSLLPTDEQIEQTKEVSPKQLRHLLRLSALPEPSTPEEEAKMLKDLRSQLHFVKEIQKVDTTGVKPLRSIRNESADGEKHDQISLESLKDDLAQEEVVGKHHKRIKRRQQIQKDVEEAEKWDVLGQAPSKVGKYFVVHSADG